MPSFKIALAQINPTVGAIRQNGKSILEWVERAKKQGADLVVFPELALTGYPPDDLLLLPHFHQEVEKVFAEIQKKISGIAVLFGLPRKNPKPSGKLFCNSAVLIQEGKTPLFFDKVLIPNYDVFSELRYFEPASAPQIFELKGKKIAVTICEDIWGENVEKTLYEIDPLQALSDAGDLDAVINLSASPYSTGKIALRETIAKNAAIALKAPIFLCNQVGGNDGLLFDGSSLAIDKTGKRIQRALSFEEDLLVVDLDEKGKVFPEEAGDEGKEKLSALKMGLRDYFRKTGAKKACIGLSGGIDSAVVACIAAFALGKENVLGVAMPSRFSSKASVEDARELAENLGIEWKEVSIEPMFETALKTLEPHFRGRPFDFTEENLQSRLRALILMALSNKDGYFVLATSNKSEAAVGYTTLYGDAVGAVSVIGDLTKKQVYQLGREINRNKTLIPENIFTKAPSAELRLNQKDSDTLPEYEILDAVVESYVEEEKSPREVAEKAGCSLELALSLIKKIHASEYKRRQTPFSFRVSEKSFSSGRRFPIAESTCYLT